MIEGSAVKLDYDSFWRYSMSKKLRIAVALVLALSLLAALPAYSAGEEALGAADGIY